MSKREDRRRDKLRHLLKTAKRTRATIADCITELDSIHDNHLPNDSPFISPAQREWCTRLIASQDQAIATIQDMLAGRLPLDTLVPVPPADGMPD
jgi:hypothetical protein